MDKTNTFEYLNKYPELKDKLCKVMAAVNSKNWDCSCTLALDAFDWIITKLYSDFSSQKDLSVETMASLMLDAGVIDSLTYEKLKRLLEIRKQVGNENNVSIQAAFAKEACQIIVSESVMYQSFYDQQKEQVMVVKNFNHTLNIWFPIIPFQNSILYYFLVWSYTDIHAGLPWLLSGLLTLGRLMNHSFPGGYEVVYFLFCFIALCWGACFTPNVFSILVSNPDNSNYR